MQRSLVVLGLATLFAVPAFAAERGFYAGLDAGQYSYDLDTRGITRQITDGLEDQGLTTSNALSDANEDGFTYGVVIGYQLLPYLALEAAYVDLGDASYRYGATVSDGTTSADVRASATIDSAGPTLSALGILPFGKGWEAYARVGGYYGSNDTELRATVDGIERSASDDSSSTSLVWGGGLGYTREWYTVRLDYQRFMDVGDDDAESDVNRITIVAIRRF